MPCSSVPRHRAARKPAPPENRGQALGIGLGGFFLPLAGGLLVGWWLLPDSPIHLAQSLFLGTVLAITAIPVVAKVLIDLGQLDSRVGSLIVSSALIDDVLSLVVLSVLLALIQTGELPALSDLLLLGGQILLFFVIVIGVSRFVMPIVGRLLERVYTSEIELSVVLILAFAYALVAEALELHFILGAFAAGLFFTRRVADEEIYRDVRSKVSGISAGFLAPLFFASIGMSLDLQAVVAIPATLALLLAVAVAGKLLGAGLTAYALGSAPREATAVGIGMNGRGAVGLVLADIALKAGLFEQPAPTPAVVENLFSAVVLIIIITTLTMPFAMRLVLSGADGASR